MAESINLQKITVKMRKSQTVKLKALLGKIQETFKSLVMTQPRYGKLGDEIICSFKVSEGHYSLVIEKLIMNGMSLMFLDDKGKEVAKEATKALNKPKGNKSAGWKDLSGAKATLEVSIPDLSKRGKYKDILKISKDIRYGQEKVDEAKNHLRASINNAVDKAYNKALEKRVEADNSIKTLLEISGDKDLKNANQVEVQRIAGDRAIDLILKYPNHIFQLMKMTGNRNLPYITCVKAAISFARLVMAEQEKYEIEITQAVRDLNTRWLLIAFDVVYQDLDPKDRKAFENFIKFIRSSQ